jgi:hypothetical protein
MSEFLNISAVKKLAHDKDRQCSPEFIECLDGLVSAKIRQACESGDKRLGAESLGAGGIGNASNKLSEHVRSIRLEVAEATLKVNVGEKAEFLKILRNIRSLCEQITPHEPVN